MGGAIYVLVHKFTYFDTSLISFAELTDGDGDGECSLVKALPVSLMNTTDDMFPLLVLDAVDKCFCVFFFG